MALLLMLAATPALRFAPLAVAPAVRLAPPVMQLIDKNGDHVAAVDAAKADGRVEPTLSKAESTKPKRTAESIAVQGGSLKTWSYRTAAVQQVEVVLRTEGRPLDASIELWHGPGNIPVKMRAYVEDGNMRPFCAVLETPRYPNTVAIRNVGQLEFPFSATLHTEDVDEPSVECMSSAITIQGGALRTYPFDPSVESVQVLVRTDGRPLNARIELLQGPNSNKQIIELYSEDGLDRPFFCFLMTPGAGNVVRVCNTGPVEFPISAAVVPHSINQQYSYEPEMGGNDVVLGGPRW